MRRRFYPGSNHYIEKGRADLTICLACSHGGHLSEMIELMPALGGRSFFMITYDSIRTRHLPNVCPIPNFPANPWLTIHSILSIVTILLKKKPHLVVSTGAEIAIPVFLFSKIMGARTVFIETAARVKSPSITGRVTYHMSDHFFVQWKTLLKHYGKKARYEGGLL